MSIQKIHKMGPITGPISADLRIEATGMDGNSFDMLNDGNLTLFLGNGGCCGSTWGPNEELEIL